MTQDQMETPTIDAAVDKAKAHAEQAAEQQKAAGADRLSNIGDAVHSAADRLGREIPGAAQPLHSAADGLESIAKQLREQNIEDLAGSLSSFARQQPAAAFAACALAGFALTRFLKSSDPGTARKGV